MTGTCSVYGTSYEHGWRSRLTPYNGNDTRGILKDREMVSQTIGVSLARKSARIDSKRRRNISTRERKREQIISSIPCSNNVQPPFMFMHGRNALLLNPLNQHSSHQPQSAPHPNPHSSHQHPPSALSPATTAQASCCKTATAAQPGGK